MQRVNHTTFTPDFGGETALAFAAAAPTILPPLLAGLNGSAQTRAEAEALEALILEAERLGAIHNAHETARDPDDITDTAEVVWMAKYEEAQEACAAVLAKPPASPEDRVARATLSLRSGAYLNSHRSNWRPISLAEAVHRLTACNPELIAQAAIYLAEGASTGGPAAAAGPCPVAMLTPELERLLDAESLDDVDAGDQRDALSARIADLQAASAAGAVVQLLLASEQAELIRGCYAQEDRDYYQEQHEKLLRSAIRALRVPISPTLHFAYLGSVEEASDDAGDHTPTDLQGLLEQSDRLYRTACDIADNTPEERAEVARINRDAEELHRAFLRAPITSHSDAIAKLKWLNRAFMGGETLHEVPIVAQLIEYLGADPVTVLCGDEFTKAPAPGDLTLRFDRPEPPVLLAAE